MIRFSLKDDKDKLIDLWCNVFGDSREAVELFFEHHYKPENTLVYDVDGVIASAFYLLEGSFVISGKEHPSYYLYAAATATNYRGRGIMGKMLEYARLTATERGKDYICLLPAEKSLYDYYSKHGYKTAFRKKTVRIVNDLRKNDFCDDVNRLNPELSRKSFFKDFDRFEWNNNAIEYAIKQHKFYGGEIIFNCNGYCLYTVDGGVATVKESTLQCDKMPYIGDNCYLTLPVDYSIDGEESDISDNGMALPLNKDAEAVLETVKNAYLGLTLD